MPLLSSFTTALLTSGWGNNQRKNRKAARNFGSCKHLKDFPLEVWPQHIFAYPSLYESDTTQLPSWTTPEPMAWALLSVVVPAGSRAQGQCVCSSPPVLLSRWVVLSPTSWHKEFLQHSLSSSAMPAVTPSSRGGKEDPQSVIPEIGGCGNQPLSC